MAILDSIMGMLGPQVVGPVASQLGESTDTIQRGLQGGAAALLAGIATKANQPGFLGQIFSMLTNPANSSGALAGLTSNPGSLVSGGSGSAMAELGGRFLSSVFGPNVSGVSDLLGKATGLAGGKAGSLLSMAAPLVMGVLGRQVRDNNMTAAGLGSSLQSELPALQRFLPAGLAGLLGGGVPSMATTNPVDETVVPEKTGNRWLWPLLLLLLLAVGAWWFFNRSHEPAQEAVQTAAPASTATGLGDFYKTKLPDGTELNIPQNGIESKLIAFLNDPSKPVDTTTWFNFDRLLFDTGKDTLQPSSDEQLKNIAAIFRAYPNAHAKIGGYTDTTGDATSNLALSSARAKNVMDALVAQGVDASRLESKGYGDQYPVGDNSTEAGRALNRRISLLVTQK